MASLLPPFSWREAKRCTHLRLKLQPFPRLRGKAASRAKRAAPMGGVPSGESPHCRYRFADRDVSPASGGNVEHGARPQNAEYGYGSFRRILELDGNTVASLNPPFN